MILNIFRTFYALWKKIVVGNFSKSNLFYGKNALTWISEDSKTKKFTLYFEIFWSLLRGVITVLGEVEKIIILETIGWIWKFTQLGEYGKFIGWIWKRKIILKNNFSQNFFYNFSSDLFFPQNYLKRVRIFLSSESEKKNYRQRNFSIFLNPYFFRKLWWWFVFSAILFLLQ